MWALLDHLNASILLSAVVLLFLATQMGGQEAQIASTIRASGTGLYEAADWIERDLANLGDGVAEADPAIVDFAWDGDTPRFTFRTGNDTTLAAAATLVLYDLVPGATPEHRELRRFVVDGADTTLTARTPATLRLATLTLLDAAGQPVPSDDLGRARSVAVHLSLAPPLGATDGAVDWSRRFFPLGLAQND